MLCLINSQKSIIILLLLAGSSWSETLNYQNICIAMKHWYLINPGFRNTPNMTASSKGQHLTSGICNNRCNNIHILSMQERSLKRQHLWTGLYIVIRYQGFRRKIMPKYFVLRSKNTPTFSDRDALLAGNTGINLVTRKKRKHAFY